MEAIGRCAGILLAPTIMQSDAGHLAIAAGSGLERRAATKESVRRRSVTRPWPRSSSIRVARLEHVWPDRDDDLVYNLRIKAAGSGA